MCCFTTWGGGLELPCLDLRLNGAVGVL
jgi:hypothetical protein